LRVAGRYRIDNLLKRDPLFDAVAQAD
jgi:hypothetical protein